MKIITYACWQMTSDGFEELEQRSYEHAGEVAQCKGGSAPVADPNVQVAAQTAANHTNVVGPTGSQTYSQGERVISGYDKDGKPIYGNRETETIKLAPSQQNQFDTSNQIAEQLLNGANTRVGGLANTDYTAPNQTYQPGGANFDFNTQGQQAGKDAFARQVALMQPEFKKQDDTFEQRLANQGLPIGSEAYSDAQRQHENDRNFALTDAASAAEQEGNNLALTQQQERDNSGLAGATFNNSTALQQRQQKYNELASALGGQQISPVGSFGAGGGGGVDVGGAFGNSNDAILANFNAGQQRQANNTTAGVSALTTAATIAAAFF